MADYDNKPNTHHDEEYKAMAGHVEDSVAADYVDPTLVITPEENKKLLRKIHWHLLPVMCIAYITQSLDKGTLGTSSIMGWQADVGAVGQDYALTSTFLWAGVIIGEPIVNQLIRKLPVGKVLGGSMIVWTGLIFALAFTKNVPGVWAIRLLLGMFESSFSPCLVAITVQWYLKHEQAYITTIWQAMFAVAGCFSSLMGYAFLKVDNTNQNIHGWQWLHVLVGILSLSSTIIVLVFLPDSPAKARWATEEEKTRFIERVRVNDQGIQAKKWKSDQARETVTDPLVYLLFLMMFIEATVVGGLNTFNSLLINQAFGFDAATSQLLGMPLACFQVILYFLIAYLGTKTGQTILCMLGYTIVNIIGTIVLLTVTPSESSRGGLLICFYFMQCFQALNPSMYSLLSRNIAGQTKKSIVYAAFFIAWAGGNSVGPQLFQAVWKPRYFDTLYIHLGLYGAYIIVMLTMRFVLIRRNKKRDAALVGENMHAHAFEDMTDLQNAEFRYSY